MQVLGYSHKGARWTVKMGLATVSEKEMFIKHSAAMHTPSQTPLFAVLFCLPCLEKEGEQSDTTWEEKESRRESLRC